MRTAFIEELCSMAEQNPNIWLLTGDLGYSVLEKFSQKFPDRFLNVGVAEQNMMGIAAGLALGGKIVFVYSIANFPVMRCLEQVRNDICYHNLNVKIVAVGGGMAYGAAGYTHHAIEDLTVMAAMPNMTVLAPGDPLETHLATRQMENWAGPCYMRLGRAGESIVHQHTPDFTIGKATILQLGRQVALVSTGGILPLVQSAARLLEDSGLVPFVASFHTLMPFDQNTLLELARQVELIVCVEEHRLPAILPSLIAPLLIQFQPSCRLISFNLGNEVATAAYHRDSYLNKVGLTDTAIAKTVLAFCRQ